MIIVESLLDDDYISDHRERLLIAADLVHASGRKIDWHEIDLCDLALAGNFAARQALTKMRSSVVGSN